MTQRRSSGHPPAQLVRRRLLGTSGLILAGALTPGRLLAQGGDDLGRPGGDLTDPAQVLPGPFGPIGGPGGGDVPGDDTKEKMEEAGETAGEIGETLTTIGEGIAGVGGAVAGVGAVTGLGAGLGGAISILGFVVMGIGAIFNTVGNTMGELADDPPRADYRQEPFCLNPPTPHLGISYPVPPALTGHADAAAAFLASAADCLAALELWGGAYQAGDGPWMARHRASFVTHYNALRQRGAVAADTGPAVVAVLQGALNDAGLDLAAVRAHYQANAQAIRAWASDQQRTLMTALAAQCGEIAHANGLRDRSAGLVPVGQLDDRYRALGAVMRALPVYS